MAKLNVHNPPDVAELAAVAAQALEALSALSDRAPYTDGMEAVDSILTVDRSHGFFQQATLTGSPAVGLATFVGAATGKRLLLRIVSAAGTDRTLTLAGDGSQVLPDEYAGPNPITLPGGHSRTLQFYCNGTQWELQSIGGSYPLPPA